MLRVQLLGVADHAEQAAGLRHTVDREVGVEDFVAAVLAVGLRKHHQLDVGRVALQLGEGLNQVIHLVRRQRQAKFCVGFGQCAVAPGQHVNRQQRCGMQRGEQTRRIAALGHHAFGHAVMQQRGNMRALGFIQSRLAKQARLQRDAVLRDALDAFDGQAAVVGNVSGFGRPGRHGAESRGNDKHRGVWHFSFKHSPRLTVSQQCRELFFQGFGRCRLGGDKVDKAGTDAGDLVVNRLQAGQQLQHAKVA